MLILCSQGVLWPLMPQTLSVWCWSTLVLEGRAAGLVCAQPCCLHVRWSAHVCTQPPPPISSDNVFTHVHALDSFNYSRLTKCSLGQEFNSSQQMLQNGTDNTKAIIIKSFPCMKYIIHKTFSCHNLHCTHFCGSFYPAEPRQTCLSQSHPTKL